MRERTLNVPSDPSDRTRAFQPTITAVCPDCHAQLVYDHDAYCPGPLQRVWWETPDEAACDCPPGMVHRPDCELVA